jgi:hypothetical protein
MRCGGTGHIGGITQSGDSASETRVGEFTHVELGGRGRGEGRGAGAGSDEAVADGEVGGGGAVLDPKLG